MLLDLRSLTVAFPSPRGGEGKAVRDVSFSIAPGESLGLVGESGSGKSVTSLAILRLLPPQARFSGQVRFDSRTPHSSNSAPHSPDQRIGNRELDLLTAPEAEMRHIRGARIAMIFQEPMTALNPVMRVGAQVAESVLAHHRMPRAQAAARALEALREVGIPDPERRARDYPHQFSGGQRQRIMIAMAIVNRPQLLIADEPTTALDVTIQAQILALLAELRRKFGLSMLFISHDLAVISQVVDRVAVMYRGNLVELAPVAELFRNPLHPYTRGLLNSVPTMTSDRHRPLAAITAALPAVAPLPPGVAPPLTPGALVEVSPGHLLRC